MSYGKFFLSFEKLFGQYIVYFPQKNAYFMSMPKKKSEDLNTFLGFSFDARLVERLPKKQKPRLPHSGSLGE